MATPYLAEIKIMSFNFPPKGWAFCNGQQLPINQNQALFSLLGTTYGGNGQTTFALPDLRGKTPVHMGSGFTLGQVGGQYAHTLTISEMPQHVHAMMGVDANGDNVVPTGAFLGGVSNQYGPATNLTTLSPTTVSQVGGNQPHENTQPYNTLNCCIALQGIFPSQS